MHRCWCVATSFATAASEYGDIEFASGTNQILWTADPTSNDADIFDAGEVGSANTDPTTTLGAELHSMLRIMVRSSTADFLVAEGVNVVTDGFANIGLALTPFTLAPVLWLIT